MEGLRLLVNKLQAAQFGNTKYNTEFTKPYPIGDTLRVKYPQLFTVRDGLGYNPQGINRRYTTVTVDQIFGVDFETDSIEAALKMERGREMFKEEYLDKAMATMAQEIDSRFCLWAYQHTNMIAGVLGTDPTSFSVFLQGRQQMIQQACPPSGDKGALIAPRINTALVAAQAQYFNPTSEISKAYKEGSIGRNSGFDWYEVMSLYTHTAGTYTSPTVTNAGTDGMTSMNISVTAGNVINAGDKLGIGSVYPTNPMTRRQSSTSTMTITVLNSIPSAAGGGADVIQFSPPLFGPGSQYQNVTALPAAGATLTLFPGTTTPNGLSGTVNLLLHEDAFAIVGVPMEVPKATEISSQTRDPQTGIAVRFVRMFDPQQSKMINRFDCLLGFGDLYPGSCAVAVLSA